jgi:hypothetical protein
VFRYCCIAFIALSFGAAVAPAQATRPLTPTSAPSPTELYNLHVQAVKLMRANQFDKAKPLLEKVYVQTPPGQRSRALVLNRAIMDLAQRTNVSRGVRDVTAYLAAHPEPDELAINILGASLNLMAERYNGKRNPAWQASLAEWDRQNAQLEQTRPGMHRWGVEWLDEEQYARLQFTRDRAATAVRDQEDRVSQAQAEFLSAQQQREGLSAALGNSAQNSPGLDGRNSLGNSGQIPAIARPDQFNNAVPTGNLLGMQGDIKRLDREVLPALRKKVAEEQAKVAAIEDKQPRPEWPKRFDAIDPEPFGAADGLASATTQPVSATTVPAAATQPASSDPLAQAVLLIKRNETAKAREALDAIWKATPPEQRSRALVLNRAIVDLGDRRFVIRAVRDLGEYLAAHPAVDEPATNVLAAALNNAAFDPRLKRGEIWQLAWKEWSGRNEALDQSRPGFRRWGADWLTDEQYAALRQRQKELEDLIHRQGEIVDADLRRAGDIDQAMSVREFIQDAAWFAGVQTNSVNKTIDSQFYDSEREYVQNVNQFFELNAARNSARAEVQRDMAKLKDLILQRERPTWPTRFEPVDPSEGSR